MLDTRCLSWAHSKLSSGVLTLANEGPDRSNAFNYVLLYLFFSLRVSVSEEHNVIPSMAVLWGNVLRQKESNLWVSQNLIWFPPPPPAVWPWTKPFKLSASVSSSVKLRSKVCGCSLTRDSLGKVPMARRHSVDVEMDWGHLMIYDPADIYVQIFFSCFWLCKHSLRLKAAL